MPYSHGMNLTDVETTRVDDIPLLLAMIAEMGIQQQIDEYVKPHGLWQGVTVGTIVAVWLCYILTEGDHRLEPVEGWVHKRKALFELLLGTSLRRVDFTDDRLANVLTMLGVETVQEMIDRAWNREWITLYELPTEITRYDSTTVSLYQEANDEEESIIGYGHSKDHRPELAQFKVMLSSLEMGMPLTCRVVNGKRADDKLYLPAYDSVVDSIGHSRFLAVGDSKMAAWQTRCHLVRGGSHYLCPYRGAAARGEDIDGWIETAIARADKRQEVTRVDERTGEISTIATVHEWQRQQTSSNDQGQQVQWQERVLVSHSPAMQKGVLKRRLRSEAKLYAELDKLARPPKRGRKRYREREELESVVAQLLKKNRFEGIITVSLQSQPHKDGGKRWIVAGYERNQVAWEAMVARLGWQVYLTSLPIAQADTAALIHIYRGQPQLERGMSRLKSRHLNIRPVYLQDEQRIVGLTWLLVLALRFIVLMEFRARRDLATNDESIRGLKAGNKNTATKRPTTEKMLKAFEGVTWSIITIEDTQHLHVTPLTDTQRHILRLLGLSTNIYERLAAPAPKPLLNLRE
jgi:transposase